MEFLPQVLTNSRTLLVLAFMAWGVVAYGIRRRVKHLRLVAIERSVS